MTELDSNVLALLKRMEAFLADPSSQTIEKANAIYKDTSYRALLRVQLMNPTVRSFLTRHVDLQRPAVIQRLKDEIARREGSGQ